MLCDLCCPLTHSSFFERQGRGYTYTERKHKSWEAVVCYHVQAQGNFGCFKQQ